MTLWQVYLADGRVASATLAPTADTCVAAWYLDEELQDVAQFPDRVAALASAENVRRMITAPAASRRPCRLG